MPASLTKTRIGSERCVDGDKRHLYRLLAKKGSKAVVVDEIPAPFAKNRFHFNCSRFLLSDGSVADIFHSRPVYYHTKNLSAKPLEEICSHYGNRKIILKDDPFSLDISIDYLIWLAKRQILLRSVLSWNFHGIRFPVVLNTTSTFYPDPNPETTSVDGGAYRDGVNQIWADIRAGAGTGAYDASTSVQVYYFRGSTTSNQWQALTRQFYLFDTNAIPDTDEISSATFSIYGITPKNDPNSNTPAIALVGSTPTSNTAIAATDYSQVGSTEYASRFAYSSFTLEAYNDMSLNSTGISNIVKDGITKFATRSANDIDNSAPSWGSEAETDINGYSADNAAGTAKAPKLVVIHAPPVTFIPKVGLIL